MKNDNPRNLRDAIKRARQLRTKRYEKNWKRVRTELQGARYRTGQGEKTQTNFLYLYTTTYLPLLAGRNPRCRIRARREVTDAVMAMGLEMALRDVLVRTNFLSEMRRCIVDSFYAFGMMKTGMMPSSALDRPELATDPGNLMGDEGSAALNMPFAERISPFNCVWDDDADDFRGCQFVGHEFYRDHQALMAEAERYPELRKLVRDAATVEGLEYDSERYGELTQELDGDLPPMHRMLEVYVPPTQQLYTLLETKENDFTILRKVTYSGPAKGPFHMLGYTPAPDKALPLAPLQAVFDQYLTYELNERKINEQARAEKRIVNFEDDQADAAKIYKQARDNGIVVGAGKGVTLHHGGVTGERLAYKQVAENHLERVTGITDARRGVASHDTTATAANIAESNASVIVRDMRKDVTAFLEGVCQDLVFYMHEDESFEASGTVNLPDGTRAEADFVGGPSEDPHAQSVWTDYAVEIDPDSLYEQSSEVQKMRVSNELGMVMNVIRPALMSQGLDINVVAAVRDWEDSGVSLRVTPSLIAATPEAQALIQQADTSRPSGGQIKQLTTTGDGGTQSSVMNTPETSAAIRSSTQAASPMRQANTVVNPNNSQGVLA